MLVEPLKSQIGCVIQPMSLLTQNNLATTQRTLATTKQHANNHSEHLSNAQAIRHNMIVIASFARANTIQI